MPGRTTARSADARAADATALPRAPRSRFELPEAHRGVLTDAERALALAHVRALLEVPTAPYAEDGPLAVVLGEAAAEGPVDAPHPQSGIGDDDDGPDAPAGVHDSEQVGAGRDQHRHPIAAADAPREQAPGEQVDVA